MFQVIGYIILGAVLVVLFPTFASYVVSFLHWFATLLQNAQVTK